MRLASVVALAVLAALPANAVAARTVGAPATLRPLGAGAPLSHPSAPHQTWELSGIDRRSGRVAMVRLSTNPELDSEVRAGTPGEVAGHVPGAPLGAGMRLISASTRSVRLGSAQGSARIARTGARLVAEIDAEDASGRLVLSRITRGPLARRWSLGRLTLDGRGPVPQRISLAVPALTARLDGELTIDGATLRIRGWRASLEHVWGDLSFSPRTWDGWNAVTLQGSSRSAWLAFGLTRNAVTAYDGAVDGQWAGVLARARAGRVRLCRPAVHRRPNPGVYVTVIRLQCWGRRITLRMRPARGFLWSYVNLNDGRDWDELGRLAQGPGGAAGVARVLDPSPPFGSP
jgi:hypothetical protein